MNKKKELMFGFITHTVNPLGGKCYDCEYCCINSIRGMKYRFKHLLDKYTGEYKLYDSVLKQRFKDDSFVFFCNCIDYLHENVPEHMILSIFEWIERIRTYNRVRFLSLTKNPKRYLSFIFNLPMMYLGCTIESNRDYPLLSKAPLQHLRLGYMNEIANNDDINFLPRMICIEPILKFDLIPFVYHIKNIIRPDVGYKDFVVIGYDNHNHKLPEPKLSYTHILIHELERLNIKVITKTIRKAWDET